MGFDKNIRVQRYHGGCFRFFMRGNVKKLGSSTETVGEYFPNRLTRVRRGNTLPLVGRIEDGDQTEQAPGKKSCREVQCLPPNLCALDLERTKSQAPFPRVGRAGDRGKKNSVLEKEF